MHELGHNLGLHHGGFDLNGNPDDTNNKPNYFSIMNYSYNIAGLRFSKYINDNFIIDQYIAAVWFKDKKEVSNTYEVSNQKVDFNANGQIDKGTIKCDINNDGKYTILRETVNDWNNLTFKAKNIGSNGAALKAYLRDFMSERYPFEVTAEESVPNPNHIHSYSDLWLSNSISHWHECECGEKSNVAFHTSDGGTITKPATETEEGVRTYKCKVCDYVIKTEPIAKLEHTHTPATEWTSDSIGHWHTCPGCAEKIGFAAHTEDNGVVTVKPTITNEGIRTYSCNVCGYVMRTEPIPVITGDHIHNYSTVWSSDNTNHWHECDCGDKTDEGTHVEDSGVVTVQPTTTSTGVKTYSCSVCGRFLRNEELPKTEDVHTHSYSTAWNCDSTSHWHQRSCGDKADIGRHISNGGIVTVQPTYNSTGVRTYSCTVCGYVMHTETIPALKQDYYPNYDNYIPYVSVTPSYSFEQIKLTGKISKNNVILKWTDIEDADKYTVYQLVDGKYKALKTTTKNTYTVKNLPTGKYKFIVRYTTDGRISPISKCNSLTANIKNSKPYPIATVKNNIVTLKWQPVDNAEKYAIYLVKDGKATKLKEIKKASVKYTLKPGKEYQFVVRAYVDGKWTTMKTSDIVKVTAEG